MFSDLNEPIIIEALKKMDDGRRRLDKNNESTNPVADRFRVLIPYFDEPLIKDGDWNLDYYLRLRCKSRINSLNVKNIEEIPDNVLKQWKAYFFKRSSVHCLYAFMFVLDGVSDEAYRMQRKLGYIQYHISSNDY